ncbi:hypothetical protein D4R51_00075 [bacterium]|nr:MAG: hypothetical protein D4R51_00075 [bacterium]
MTPGIQVISESREAEVDRSIWKIILLGFLGIVASVATVSGFNHFLSGLNNFYFWPTVVAFAFFIVLAILQIFLVKGLGKLSIIAFMESAAPLALFWDKLYPQTNIILILGAVFAFIFLFAAARRGRKVLENSIKLNFFETSKSFVPKIVTGFLIFFSILLYLNYFEWGNFSQEMGRSIVSGAIMGSEPIVKIIMPGISLNLTIHELLRNMATDQLKSTRFSVPGVSALSPETDFRALPKRDQEKLINQAIDQLQSAMVGRFGSFDPNEKIADFAYDLVNRYFSASINSSPWILPIITIGLFFFFAKGILVLFYWLFTLLAFLIFKSLIFFDFAYYNLETRSREFILLS